MILILINSIDRLTIANTQIKSTNHVGSRLSDGHICTEQRVL